MGINYHAYQCRGFLLSDYEEIMKQWHQIFSNYHPERVVRILELQSDDDYLYIPYYQNVFRLHLGSGVLERQVEKVEKTSKIERKPLKSSYITRKEKSALELEEEKMEHSENGWTKDVYFNESMAIYHLLQYVKDTPLRSGKWIPNSSLDPREIRNDKKENLLCTTFAKEFSGRLEELEQSCQKNGGKKVESKADLSYQFCAFPQVELQLLYWDADEEFEAQVQILVDSQVTDYVHLETTGCMVADLFERLSRR
jgi:hypothetical protein